MSVNKKIISLHQVLNSKPFPGFVESVPAYSSLAVFYDTVAVRKQLDVRSAFGFVKSHVEKIAGEIQTAAAEETKETIIIPVYYNGEDLEHVAALHNLTTEEVIQLHSSKTYHVYMNGFLPGFAYMGTVDEKIATPRKENPRMQVAAGSVGIAGTQTGIYPFDSPGGWQIIGTAAAKMFDRTRANPCLVNAGDAVKFVSISKTEFEKINGH